MATQQEIQQYLSQFGGNYTPEALNQIATAAQQYNVSPQELAQASGFSVKDVNAALLSAASLQQQPVTTTAITPTSTSTTPAPTWLDAFNRFQAAHTAQFGIGIDRPWTSDADAARAKEAIDQDYLNSLAQFNASNNSNLQPDTSVLGVNAQTTGYVPKPEWHGTLGAGGLGGLLGGIAGYALAPMTGGLSLAAAAALGAGGGTLLGGGNITDAARNAALGYGGASLVSGLGGAAGAGSATSGMAAPGSAADVIASMGGAGGGVTAAQEAAGMLSAAGAPGVAASTAASNVATGLGYDMLGTAATGGGMLGGIAPAVDPFAGTGYGASTGGAVASPEITQATQTLAQSGITPSDVAANSNNPAWLDSVTKATGLSTSMLGTIASTGLNLLGGYLQGQSATDAARITADAQKEAARIAAESQMLRPMPVKNLYGEFTPSFDAQGRLTGLNTATADWLAGQQKQLIGMSGTELQRAQDISAATSPMIPMSQQMFGLSQGYLQTSPQAQAAKYMEEQQALLAPTRERQMAQMLASEQSRGTLGLGVGATTTGFGAANPRLEAMLNAQRMQDLGLAAQATQGGMEAAQFGAQMGQAGTQMLGQVGPTAAGGFQAYGTVMRGLEGTQQMAEQPMKTSLQWSSPATAAAAAAGQSQAQGMLGAAQTMQPANTYSPWGAMLSGAGQAIGNYQTQQQQQQQQQQFQNNLMNQLITGRV